MKDSEAFKPLVNLKSMKIYRNVFLQTENASPSLSWLAEIPEAALKGIRKVVAEGAKILEADGEPTPKALSNKKYSGKFSIRIPPEVHRNLSIQAAEEGISLNRLIGAKLS